MPASDFGVRKGYANIYFAKAKLKLDPKALPAPLEVIKQAEKWRPYRSAAAWYLWRASEGK
jgi:DNA-3-methyladenine glycosylase II